MSNGERSGRRPLRWGRFIGLGLVPFVGFMALGIGAIVAIAALGLHPPTMHASQIGEAVGNAVAPSSFIALLGGFVMSYFVVTGEPGSPRRRWTWLVVAMSCLALLVFSIYGIADAIGGA